MSIHPLVLATLENLRTHAELQAEALRSRRESTSSDLPHATAIGRRLREADAIAGSWRDVLAAVAAADDDTPVPQETAPGAAVDELVSSLREEEPHDHVWVTAEDEKGRLARDSEGRTWTHCDICGDRKALPGSGEEPKRRWAVSPGTTCYDLMCKHARTWHASGDNGACTFGNCDCPRFVAPSAEARKARVNPVVGYRLGKRLRCVQHPFASMRDTAVTAQELEGGEVCELAECGRDLLA